MAIPAFIQPELATLASAIPSGNDWIFELKYDGYRIVARIEGRNVTLFTRNGHDWTDKFPTIVSALKRLQLHSSILDGEICAIEKSGKSNFQLLQNHLEQGVDTSLRYIIFDAPYFEGTDLRGHTLRERRQQLEALFRRPIEHSLTLSDRLNAPQNDLLHIACRGGFEGVIAKRFGSKYASTRTREWLKIKCSSRQEFVICGFIPHKNSSTQIGSLILGVFDNDTLLYAGKVGTGFDNKERQELYRRLSKLARATAPFETPVPDRGVTWVRPSTVAEINFTEWTEDGRLRHPSFKGLRSDKPAKDVPTREGSLMTPINETLPESLMTKVRSSKSESPALSHPDKVLYPDVGITKQDLADYYSSVAQLMMPYIRNRPLTVLRCPGGKDASCFFQKHPDRSLTELPTIKLKEKDSAKKEPYVYVKDGEDILDLVQSNVLEMHVWGSKVENVERPDLLIFDLDPDIELPFGTLKKGALMIRNLLEELGLPSFLKTTGGKGLHLVTPLDPTSTWNEVKEFSHHVALMLESEQPKLFTANLSKQKRGGKIFIDYLRNGRGATAIAPYSTRAKPGATVSLPLSWKELENARTLPTMTVQTIGKYLKKRSADPWFTFFNNPRPLPAIR